MPRRSGSGTPAVEPRPRRSDLCGLATALVLLLVVFAACPAAVDGFRLNARFGAATTDASLKSIGSRGALGGFKLLALDVVGPELTWHLRPLVICGYHWTGRSDDFPITADSDVIAVAIHLARAGFVHRHAGGRLPLQGGGPGGGTRRHFRGEPAALRQSAAGSTTMSMHVRGFHSHTPLTTAACLALALSACGLAGCSLNSDTTGPLDDLLPGANGLFWVGSYVVEGGAERRLTLKLDRHDTQVSAILVVESSRFNLSSYQLSGTTGEAPLSLREEPYPKLTIERWTERESGLDIAGTLRFSYYVQRSFTARQVPRGRMIVLASGGIRETPVGLVADDQGLVVSTYSMYYRMDPLAEAFVDSFVVGSDGYHNRAGTFLTWDGLQFRMGIGSHLAAFTGGGPLPPERVPLTHETCGLACSGQVIWSLEREAAVLHSLDLDGTPGDSCIVEDPDVSRLARYGIRLLTQAQLDRYLAVLSTDGTLEHVYDYPTEWQACRPYGVEVTMAGDIYQLVSGRYGYAGVLQRVALVD